MNWRRSPDRRPPLKDGPHDLDAAEQAELDALLDRIKAYEYERDVLEPRRAAAKHREQEYARAADYALRWTGWKLLPPDVVKLQRHAVDLSLQPPVVQVRWLERDTRSEELIRPNVGVSFTRSHVALAPPITCVRSYLTVVHEVLHSHVPQRNTRLQVEIEVWRKTRSLALTWDAECQDVMVRSLESYTNNTEKQDVLDVMAAEELCSPTEFRRERQRRLEMALAEDEARLDALLKDKRCHRCQRQATTLYAGRPYCSASCEALASEEAKRRELDAEIERMRRLRAQMASRRETDNEVA